MADVVTARKRLELHAQQLRPAAAGIDEATPEALSWRAALETELAELDRQSGELAGEEARLRQVVAGLELRLRQVLARRNALMAGYEAARARVEVGQVLADVRARDTELLRAVQDAERRVAQTRAVADALEGRAASRGALGPASDEQTRREEELLWGPATEEERRPPRDEGGA